MDKSKIYLDLSKCTEEQHKHIISLLPPTTNKDYEIHDDYKYLHFIRDIWFVDYRYFHKTELTYPDFIKLFEGGEDYPGNQYQPLFDHLNSEHGLILHESEMDEIIRIVNNLNSNQ